MFHSSLTSALTEATPLACQALLSQGVKFVVAVENGKGEWLLLHADDQGQRQADALPGGHDLWLVIEPAR